MHESLFICEVSDIKDPGSRGFTIQHKNKTLEGFVVQKDGQFFAYLNSCPHTNAPLDWVEHQFLDGDEALIQCAVHGALFEIETGVCLAGPCAGQSLQLLQIMQKNNKLFLAADKPA